MIFNSFEFIFLFVSTVVLYYLLAPSYRKPLLLLSSVLFIGFAHWGFLAMALGTSVLTYCSGLWIEKNKEEGKRATALRVSLVAHLLLLAFFKYYGFLESNLVSFCNLFGANMSPWLGKIFLPLGISFYIFQSISYLVEIYWEEQPAERNVLDFLIYMLFFMKFLSGPIERPYDFLPQLKKKGVFQYDDVIYGLKLIAIGFFKKLIIADRLAPVLNDVFSSVHDFSGAQLLVATLVYPLQLYADFSGYTDIAIGGALMLGFKLSPNFNRPFTAQTITDFWRRWHMSLSFWVRDYIYEPVAAERRYWGKWGIVFSLMVTFILLGLWHGGSWNFVIYGTIQGLVICYEMLFGAKRTKWGARLPSRLFSIYGVIRTYLIFSVSLLFFRIETFSDVFYTISSLFSGVSTSIKELRLGLSDHHVAILLSGVVLMFLYEALMARKDLWRLLEKQHVAIRWSVYYMLVILIFSFGEFGTKDFIYFQF